MLKIQNDLFYLDKNVHYLNNAYMSPNLKSVEIAGIVGVRMKNQPHLVSIKHFFEPVEHLKKSFARIINCDNHERIAIVPSASYGLANVAKNIKLSGKKKIIIPAEQFPSNYYVWEELAKNHGLSIEIVSPPLELEGRGQKWNEKILEAIDGDTAIVACGHVHWADGTKFELKAFREECDKHSTLLILDVSQSLGALPFDIREVQADALVCVGYKWLFGPYGIGFAYYNEKFDNGTPIEENWINRADSEDFASLVNYQSKYKPHANRYSVGESSKFIAVPMMQTALDQIRAWDVNEIQNYSKSLVDPFLEGLKSFGCTIEDENYRCNHLLGIRLPAFMDTEILARELKSKEIYVSVRGSAIRVSTSVYNSKRDMDRFFATMHQTVMA